MNVKRCTLLLFHSLSRSGGWSVAADDVVVIGLPLFSLLLLSSFFSIAPATTLHSCPNIATTVIEEEEQSISRTVQKIKKIIIMVYFIFFFILLVLRMLADGYRI